MERALDACRRSESLRNLVTALLAKAAELERAAPTFEKGTSTGGMFVYMTVTLEWRRIGGAAFSKDRRALRRWAGGASYAVIRIRLMEVQKQGPNMIFWLVRLFSHG